MDGQRLRLRTSTARPTPLSEHLAALPVVAWTAAARPRCWSARRGSAALHGPRRRGHPPGGPRGAGPLPRGPAAEARARWRASGPGLEIWNELLAATAADVIAQRHRLRRGCSRCRLAEVLAEPRACPSRRSSCATGPRRPTASKGAAAIARALDRIADRERRRQLPLLGPHRDELEILWDGHEIRRVASAGERKALSLLLLAAHGRVMEAAGRSPGLPPGRRRRRARAGRRGGGLEGLCASRRPALRHLQPAAGLADPRRGPGLGDGERRSGSLAPSEGSCISCQGIPRAGKSRP